MKNIFDCRFFFKFFILLFVCVGFGSRDLSNFFSLFLRSFSVSRITFCILEKNILFHHYMSSADRGGTRGGARGVGGGRGGAISAPIQSQMRDAGSVRGTGAQYFYINENRARANEQVLSEDAELRNTIDRGEEETEEFYNAEDTLYIRSSEILRKEYDALSAAAKEYYLQQEKESQADAWRRMRKMGRLIENEASLAQKAEDDRMIASGAPANFFDGSSRGRGRGRGRGGEVGDTLGMMMMSASFGIGGRQEMIPPFDLTIKTIKVGVMTKEEYF